jgi:hypothetical protein
MTAIPRPSCNYEGEEYFLKAPSWADIRWPGRAQWETEICPVDASVCWRSFEVRDHQLYFVGVKFCRADMSEWTSVGPRIVGSKAFDLAASFTGTLLLTPFHSTLHFWPNGTPRPPDLLVELEEGRVVRAEGLPDGHKREQEIEKAARLERAVSFKGILDRRRIGETDPV